MKGMYIIVPLTTFQKHEVTLTLSPAAPGSPGNPGSPLLPCQSIKTIELKKTF
jgi:hypothetical protein